MDKIAYIYVLNTMADWEAGYLIAELNTGRFFKPESDRYFIKTVSLTSEPVMTMGGVRIVPDLTLDAMTPKNAGLLILPGGETWLDPIHVPLLDKVEMFLKADVTVGAICGGTMALAQKGILDHCRHTSNDLHMLKQYCPNYRGEKFYENSPAVSNGKLITASGAAPLDFAYQILKTLDVFLPETLDAWYNLFLTRDPKYFDALMRSIQ